MRSFLSVYVLISHAPRNDEVDASIVYYWCNIRVEGSEKNLQKEKLKQSVSAEGTTDSFSMEKIQDGIDLRSLGCKGPVEEAKKPTQAVAHKTNCCLFSIFQELILNKTKLSQATLGTPTVHLRLQNSCKAHMIDMHSKELLQVTNKCTQLSDKMESSELAAAKKSHGWQYHSISHYLSIYWGAVFVEWCIWQFVPTDTVMLNWGSNPTWMTWTTKCLLSTMKWQR